MIGEQVPSRPGDEAIVVEGMNLSKELRMERLMHEAVAEATERTRIFANALYHDDMSEVNKLTSTTRALLEWMKTPRG